LKSALDVLGDLSGLSKPALNEILEQVRANQALLNACARHEFEQVLPVVPLRQKYRCKRCGGEVDHHAWYWHQQGRRQ
jgi:hypothetical protein